MSAEILSFTGDTLVALKPDDILEAAKEKLEDAMILGWTIEEGFYLASTTSKAGEMLLLLELAKSTLIRNLRDGN